MIRGELGEELVVGGTRGGCEAGFGADVYSLLTGNLTGNFTKIGPFGEKNACKNAAKSVSCRTNPYKIVPKRLNRLEREIAPIDIDNDAGLVVIDDQLAGFHIIPQEMKDVGMSKEGMMKRGRMMKNDDTLDPKMDAK